MLLWLQLSSVVMLDCHPILIKIKIISRTFEKKTIQADSVKCCLVLIKSTPDIVYGVARENNAVDLLPHQKQNHTGDCKHLTKNARQCFFGHPCLLSLNPLRESIQLLLWKKGIFVDQPKQLLPLSNHCFSQTSELDKRRCILSEVVPESAFKYYCDLFNRRSYQNSGFDVFVLDIQTFTYGDRSQISQMKVTDG